MLPGLLGRWVPAMITVTLNSKVSTQIIRGGGFRQYGTPGLQAAVPQLYSSALPGAEQAAQNRAKHGARAVVAVVPVDIHFLVPIARSSVYRRLAVILVSRRLPFARAA